MRIGYFSAGFVTGWLVRSSVRIVPYPGAPVHPRLLAKGSKACGESWPSNVSSSKTSPPKARPRRPREPRRADTSEAHRRSNGVGPTEEAR